MFRRQLLNVKPKKYELRWVHQLTDFFIGKCPYCFLCGGI